ncbi:hypothetical protein QBC39DRAFT_432499 [Podospora conica]|nr:hypothetical protein QBC39DRAFT_432499 [Schizothecium conicum]
MAELALGAIPLAALAISGFKYVQTQIKTYKHVDRMVRRWDRELRGHARTFKEACRAALGHAGSLSTGTQSTISEMLKDPLHPKWGDSDMELGKELAEWLGPERIGDWVETVTDIKEVIKELTATLGKFSTADPAGVERDDALVSQKVSGMSRRLKASFQEKDVQKSLDELGKLNRALCDIQKDAAAPEGRLILAPQARRVVVRKGDPNQHSFQDLGQRRRALGGLHEGIVTVWRCNVNGTRHAKHSIKLFLDTEPGAEVASVSKKSVTKLGYAYQPGDTEIRVLELQVQSNAVVSKHDDHIMTTTAVPDSGSRDEGRGSGKRRKGVRWADEPIAGPCSPSQPTATAEDVVDFRSCTDLCYFMTQPVVKVCPVNGFASLGHIDTHAHEGFRHHFIPTVRDICGRPGCSILTNEDVLTIDDILDQRIDGYLDVKDRIRLAKSLVEMVLTLHSTPWLAKSWTLRDIRFVRRGDDLVASLESLHVEADLHKTNPPPAPQSVEVSSGDTQMLPPEWSKHTSLWSSLESTTKNEQLWSLGVALLETDAWSHLACDDKMRMVELLKSRPSIGTRFREITEQCLTGRFRCGSTDLNNPHLESELVELVDEMGSMVKTLEQMGL